MTTNAGPEYFVAQAKYQEARTTEQKLAALKDMFKHAPKHKSSENMVAEITYKISKLKKELEKQKEESKKKGGGASLNVKKEGAGQIAIVGMPNSGKSQLLKELTGVNVEIAPYPFTTTKPEIGMMNFKGARTQIIEVPALIEGSSEGKANGTQLLSVARNADAIILMHRDESERKVIVKELEKAGIIVERKKPRITISTTDFQGITIAGKNFLQVPEKDFAAALKRQGISKASILLEEPADTQKLEEALDDSLDYKNCLFVKTMDSRGIEMMKERVFSLLEKIIVYTKRPGGEPEYGSPLVLKRGATVSEAAMMVHKEMAKNLKFARVWGSAKFPGQRVAKEYALSSEDIIELSA